MRDKLLLTFIAMNMAFLASGVLLLVFGLTAESNMSSTPKLGSVGRDVALKEIPRTGQTLNLHLHD